jgi:protein-tyrosine phosphatase
VVDPTADRQEVLPRLWLGSSGAAAPALAAGFRVLCVLEEPMLDTHIPVLLPPVGQRPALPPCAYVKRLEEARRWICEHWSVGVPTLNVLVHCAAGVERSPLTLAWFLIKQAYCPDLDHAYAWLMSHRPVVQDRRSWLEELP